MIITDELKSYSAARAEVMPSVEQAFGIFTLHFRVGRHLYRADCRDEIEFRVCEEASCARTQPTAFA